MLPEPVRALLAVAFPGDLVAGLEPTVGGFSHLTVAAMIGGRSCVVKASDLQSVGLRHEAHVLTLLAGQGLPCPPLLATLAGNSWTVLVMRRLPGQPGIELYNTSAASLCLALHSLGRALATLHHLRLPAIANADLAARARTTAAALHDLPLPAPLRSALVAALAHPAWYPVHPCLVHGDAGLHNVIWYTNTATLIDWEWAAFGNPLLDLAWVAWTLHFRGQSVAAWDALLAGYGPAHIAAVGLNPTAMRALALGQIAAFLLRSVDRPHAWTEWLRRAEWTVSLPQIPPIA